MKKSSIEYMVKEEFNMRLTSLSVICMDKIEGLKIMTDRNFEKNDR